MLQPLTRRIARQAICDAAGDYDCGAPYDPDAEPSDAGAPDDDAASPPMFTCQSTGDAVGLAWLALLTLSVRRRFRRPSRGSGAPPR